MKMQIKTIIDEDFNNYKKPSMLIGFPNCSFKCDKECGEQVCQNSTLATSPNTNIPIKEITKRYLENNLTNAIVCGGLEPFDSWNNLLQLVEYLREKIDDDIVIFTGYNREEISEKINELKKYKNIIVKFGRFVPGQDTHYDEVLGVFLASNNQYAERIS